MVTVMAVAVSVTMLAAGLVGFFADLLWASADVLDALDKRASVISMFVGIAGLLVAGAALLAQLRPPAPTLPRLPPTPLDETAGTQPPLDARTTGLAGVPAVAGQSARQALPSVSDVPADGVIGLPRRQSMVFVGRGDELEALGQALKDRPGVITQAVIGLGGIGKSELALHYATRHRDAYRLVWWIDAEGPDNIQTGLAGLCRALCAATAATAAAQVPTEEAVAWALAWLGAHSDWLVVWDNVEDIEDVQPYLGRLHTGHVLITSRRDVGWQEVATVLTLGILPRAEAVRLLLEMIGSPAAEDERLAAELAEELGDLPLALKQAGAYIVASPGMDLARYLRLLHTTPQRVLAADSGRRRDADQVVARTWAVTTARIAETDPPAMRLLRLLACYAPDHLPCQVLYGLADTDEVAVAEALGVLASYSMISRSVDGQELSIHRLVQAVTWAELSDDERARVRATAAGLLEAALPADPEAISSWPLYARLLPHARAVLAPESPAMAIFIAYLTVNGDWHTARTVQQQRVTALQDELGLEHLDTLTARTRLAFFTAWGGEPAAARDQITALLPVMERALGPEHPDTLKTRDDLARWTGRAGDTVTARDQITALVPVMERTLGPEHPDTLRARANLAHWTGTAGDAAAARDQFAVLASVREQVLGPEHPATVADHGDLAYWTGEAGDATAAREQLTTLLPVLDRVRGPEHPYTLIYRGFLADFTGEAGDAVVARDQLAALLPVRERVSGVEHPATLTVRSDLAHWTGVAGDSGAARDQLAVLLPVLNRVLGPEHLDTVKARTRFASWTGKAEEHS
ncbi:ATP-binding protein [Nonomuraea spiralis]|nr:ATP-binding protein [Nonomuraea spiralis]